MEKIVNQMKKVSLKEKNQLAFKIAKGLGTVMKEFVLYLERESKPLSEVSWLQYESWVLKEGLSTMYMNCPPVDWSANLEDLYFPIWASALETLEDRHSEDWLSDLDEELKSKREEFSSLRRTAIISTSCMTARTPVVRADASSLETSQTSGQTQRAETTKHTKLGAQRKVTKMSTKDHRKGSKAEKKKAPLPPIPESENESTSEDEMPAPPPKKRAKKPVMAESESEDEDQTEGFDDMLEGLVRARSLLSSTDTCSQVISCLKGDNLITMKSPGERGYCNLKFDIMPYNPG